MDKNPSPYADDPVVGETDDKQAWIMAGEVKCCMNWPSPWGRGAEGRGLYTAGGAGGFDLPLTAVSQVP